MLFCNKPYRIASDIWYEEIRDDEHAESVAAGIVLAQLPVTPVEVLGGSRGGIALDVQVCVHHVWF